VQQLAEWQVRNIHVRDKLTKATLEDRFSAVSTWFCAYSVLVFMVSESAC